MGNEKITAEAALLQPSALICFYVLDATLLGGGVLYLTPYVSQGQQDLLWQGQLYAGFPVEFQGHEFKGQGTAPRPTIKFSNVMGTFSSLCLQFKNLCGATIRRRRTFARFLDGMPDADPAAALPDDVFEIDRKSYEDRNYVEFELASALDVEGVMLPRRQVQASQCAWIYRSAECSFAGNRCVATKDDVPISQVGQTYRGEWSVGTTYAARDVVFRNFTNLAKRYYIARASAPGPNLAIQPPNDAYWLADLCSLSLTGCGLRFGTGPKPFGGFPGTQKVQGA